MTYSIRVAYPTFCRHTDALLGTGYYYLPMTYETLELAQAKAQHIASVTDGEHQGEVCQASTGTPISQLVPFAPDSTPASENAYYGEPLF